MTDPSRASQPNGITVKDLAINDYPAFYIIDRFKDKSKLMLVFYTNSLRIVLVANDACSLKDQTEEVIKMAMSLVPYMLETAPVAN